jgi:hypothetical protein
VIKFTKWILIFFSIFFLCPLSGTAFSQKKNNISKLVYVPVYSSIYHGDQEREFNLAITLTLRNLNNSIIEVYSVDYYNNTGTLVRNYLNSVKILKPYETVNFVIKESDTRGGDSASFLIKWGSEIILNDLFAEAVMIGTKDRRGISFTSRGFSIKK